MSFKIQSVQYSIFIYLTFQISSCIRYIDKAPQTRKIQVQQGILTFYPDSNILVYKSTMPIREDTIVRNPKSFYVSLPKGITWYEMTNSQSFVFYYERNQTIAIFVDLFSPALTSDSVYILKQAELGNFLVNFPASGDKKHDLHQIGIDRGRKQLVTKKGAAAILLYNILPKRFPEFSSRIKSFKFL